MRSISIKTIISIWNTYMISICCPFTIAGMTLYLSTLGYISVSVCFDVYSVFCLQHALCVRDLFIEFEINFRIIFVMMIMMIVIMMIMMMIVMVIITLKALIIWLVCYYLNLNLNLLTFSTASKCNGYPVTPMSKCQICVQNLCMYVCDYI